LVKGKLMNFEEALTALRKGSKIWHPGMDDDEYYMACRIMIRPDLSQPIRVDEMTMSIVWMKAGKQHPDMMPYWNPNDPKTDPCKHGMCPMMNLLWVMSEGWEILNEKSDHKN
jgi:hypothetical protein